MEDPRTQLTDRLKTANNILVTVSRDPSVDQLAACIALTLILNRQGKHAAAIFSGKVPATIKFLQPEETLEKNTDSLRDFIIALDKSKADKLRYKVEDNVVRIFITPYKTSITKDDLDFSQGDFNVDLVVALGVQKQEDLDEAITSHGRILHDATVASINLSAGGSLGTINWQAAGASSLSELITELAPALGEGLLDEQIATALLTGIVAETDRFRNAKTTPATMNASATLMAAGANQQLVASKLEDSPSAKAAKSDDTLAIDHSKKHPEPPKELPKPKSNEEKPAAHKPKKEEPEESTGVSEGPKLITEPPRLSSPLTANSRPEDLDPVTDPFSLPKKDTEQILQRKPAGPVGSQPSSPTSLTPPPSNWTPPAEPKMPASGTPKDEQHEEQLGDAREEVDKALIDSQSAAPAIQALNAQPMGDELHPSPVQSPPPLGTSATPTPQADPNAPPPVPPPIPFQFGNPPKQQ